MSLLRSNRFLRIVAIGGIVANLALFAALANTRPQTLSTVVASSISQQPAQPSLQPRFISIDPYGVHPYGLIGGTPPVIEQVKGIRLANVSVGQQAFAFGLTLPPDYAEGTDFNVRFVWKSDSVTCGFKVFSAAWIGRVGAVEFSNPDITLPNAGVLLAPNTTINQEAVVQVSGVSNSGQKFKAGDPVTMLTTRESQNANDTCTGELQIFGISVIYQGLSNYLPVMSK